MKPVSSKPVSAQVLDAAIAWQLCLDCGNGSAVEQAEFTKWYSANDEHARAWLQLGMLDHRFSTASVPARNALLKARTGVQERVRKIGSGLASVALACGLALFAGKNYLPVDYWMADQRTATGEQRQLRLADGTLLNLNTHSAVDVRFDDTTRRIILQEGEIMVETGHGDPRPFIVQTRDGSLRALGTRFMVKREDDGTRLSVLQSRVEAHPENSVELTVYNEGQQVLMHRDRLGQMLAVSPGADAWTRGMLVLDNVRLADMVSELNRYQRGHLGVDPEVADLRITGSFPLNNIELALNALIPTLPVQIQQRTPWWVTVSPKPLAN
ncbi:FecR domain-containing protein [Pseudomonas deceptionensis]|uniref:FecR family protein n=1 Tax=Pseudomonas deceptionensis TaxID=882211 RepID=A0A0J6G0P6_PSEDM|nr:FecR family protein [Pseudomonas deceptionensis]KMM78606.1 amino acid ABC transporter substrate-binding protein [Pseudomonas deceptionensis]SEE55568.1 FecR family protein [Pseudomonas deceptionensis]